MSTSNITRQRIAINPVGAGISHQRFHQRRIFRVGLGGLAAITGKHEEHAAFRHEQDIAFGLLAHHLHFLVAGLDLDFVPDKFP